MSEQERTIIDSFIKEINKGEITLESIPVAWREKVQQVLDEEVSQ